MREIKQRRVSVRSDLRQNLLDFAIGIDILRRFKRAQLIQLRLEVGVV